MTEKECQTVLETIIGAYPNFLMGRKPSVVLNSWFRALKDSDFSRTMSKVDNWILERDNPPLIRNIKPWDGYNDG